MNYASRDQLPEAATCNKCAAEKPLAEMVVVRLSGGVFYVRPRCKACHNAAERGHRRAWKLAYQRRWRKRNADIDRSYWQNDPDRKEKNRKRAAARFADPQTHHAILIQGRLRRKAGLHLPLQECRELLKRFGPAYPTPQGLTPTGLKECERIRAKGRRAGKVIPAIEVRLMMYEDGHFLKPSRQQIPYKGYAQNLRRYWARKKAA